MDDLFPPVDFESTRPGRRHRRLRAIPFRMVAPNLVTLLSLVAGLTGIRMGLDGRWEWAVGAVVVAAILDGIDGRVARWVKGTSKFGAELDSLADFVNFGVVPALLLYIWLLDALGNLGWIAAMAYAIAAALRLARFNAMLETPKPDWQSDFFTGMPAPAGATAVLLPLYLNEIIHLPESPVLATPVALYTVAIGFLMVSTIPTYSGKRMSARVPKERVIPVSVALVILAALLVAYPFPMLSLVVIAYLAYIPFGWRRYHQLSARHAELHSADTATHP
jgi:CDP-diacylglycerol--serine O-phosphatidyltransferase